jgi:hypothetical protein
LKGKFCLGLIKFVEGRGGAGGGLEGATNGCWFRLAGLAFIRSSWCWSWTHGSSYGEWWCFVLSALYHFFDLILELECHIRCAVCVLYIVHFKKQGSI